MRIDTRRIYLRDLHRLGYCHKGARRFCARHGVAWDGFRKHGVDIETIRATGDAMALRLVALIEMEPADGQG